MRRYEHGGNPLQYAEIQLDFSVSVNPLGLPSAARQAIISSIDQFSAYPDCECRALRTALSQKHGVDMDQILCGNGASDLIFRICASHPGQKALTLAPTFSEYERSLKLFGGTICEFALRKETDFALMNDILEALDDSLDLFFLCNPNNPTGQLANEELLIAILERCKKNNILLIVDECFLEFTSGQSLLSELSHYQNLLILKAFTKFYGMAGLRLGYLLGDPALLNHIQQFGSEWSVSTAAQVAGIAALTEPDWETRTKALVDVERHYMENALAELGLKVFKSQSNFLLIESEQPLFLALLQQQILVRACDNFAGLDEHFIRIGLKTHEDNLTLIRAIREVLYG
jgi:threonine-phosphate decarboxylase